MGEDREVSAMAHAVELTISTGNKVSVNYQSREVGVSLTYELERDDTDVLAIVAEKSVEVAAAHALAWQELHGQEPQGQKPRGGKPPSRVNAQSHSQPRSSCNGHAHSGEVASETEPSEAETPRSCASMEDSASEEQEPPAPRLTGAQLAAIRALLPAQWSGEQLSHQLSLRYNCTRLEHLSTRQAASLLLELQRTQREATQARVHNHKDPAS